MKTFPIKLGKGRNPLILDAAKLIRRCALIQGARDSGKSYLARVIVEQTIAKGLQTVILDPEGEFSTLREKLNIMIAGKDGDVPVEISSAELLARRIAETGVSTVVDLSGLKKKVKVKGKKNQFEYPRYEFVQIFLDTFDQLPKTLLKRPRLFVLDEAHDMAPEQGKGYSPATESIITLLSEGRHRGLGTILLTQRISKLRLDAANECGCFIVGRTAPKDLPTAQDHLGITKKEREELRDIDDGVFWAAGSGLSVKQPTRFHARSSITTHPKPEDLHTLTTPPAPQAIKKILKEFEALPPSKEDEEAADFAEAKLRIKALERDLRKAAAAKPNTVAKTPVQSPGVTQEAWRSLLHDYNGLQQRLAEAHKLLDKLSKAAGRRETALEKEIDSLKQKTRQIAQKLSDTVEDPRRELPPLPDLALLTAQPAVRPVARPVVRNSPSVAPTRPPSNGATRTGTPQPRPRGSRRSNGASSSGFERMLHALAQHQQLHKHKLALMAGISAKTGTFRNYVSRGKVEGLWTVSDKTLTITDLGIEAAGDFEPLPEGSDLVDYWKGHSRVPTKAGEALDYICSMGEDGATKDEVAEHLGIQKNTGTFRNYLSRIRSLGLISGSGKPNDPFIGAEGMRA